MGFSWDTHAPGYTPLLVVEFASFGTLVDLFNKYRLEEIERQELCLDVAQGLEALHSIMIVQSPTCENVLLGKEGSLHTLNSSTILFSLNSLLSFHTPPSHTKGPSDLILRQ